MRDPISVLTIFVPYSVAQTISFDSNTFFTQGFSGTVQPFTTTVHSRLTTMSFLHACTCEYMSAFSAVCACSKCQCGTTLLQQLVKKKLQCGVEW